MGRLISGVNSRWRGSWGVSVGWNYCLRKVDVQNELNGGTWRVVVDGGRGSDDGLCGGNPLWVANRLDGVDRRGVCEARW